MARPFVNRMRRVVCCVGLAISTATLLSAVAPASDQPATVIPPALELPTGGLVFNSRDRIQVEDETLTISLDRIAIDYLIRNKSSLPHRLLMTFPLPTIDMASLFGADLAIPAYDPANPTNFVAFWTTLDGVAVEPDVEQRALALGYVDITEQLKALKLPLYPLAPDLADKLSDLTRAEREALHDAHIIDIDDGAAEPLWALRTIFHWKHLLPPEGTLAIRHHYRPVVGSAGWSAELKAKAKARYCLSDVQVAELDRRAADGKALTVYWVHYAHGNNSWLKGTSTLHKITIERPPGSGMAATCASGSRAVTDTGLSLTATNRIDDTDVEVLFVE